jgi:hypothetical protein
VGSASGADAGAAVYRRVRVGAIDPSPPAPSAPAALAGGRLGTRRWGRGRSGRLSRPDLGLRMVLNASTPAEIPSPVVLSTLFVHRSTGLTIRGEVVVLCTMEGRDQARSSLFPSAFCRAERQSRLRARSARGLRVHRHGDRRYTASRRRAARHPASPRPARAGVVRLAASPRGRAPLEIARK